MKTYGQRLQIAMDYADLKQEDLAKAAGIKQPSVNYLLNKGQGSKHTPVFASLCGVSSEWLGTGVGEMLASNPNATFKSFLKPDKSMVSFDFIPAIEGSMGKGKSTPEIYKHQIQRFETTIQWAKSRLTQATSLNNVKIITGLGDSMNGTINHGAAIFVDTGIKELNIEGVYALREISTDQLYIKRILRLPGKKYKVISDNKKYPPFTLKESDMKDYAIEGKVVGAMNFDEM